MSDSARVPMDQAPAPAQPPAQAPAPAPARRVLTWEEQLIVAEAHRLRRTHPHVTTYDAAAGNYEAVLADVLMMRAEIAMTKFVENKMVAFRDTFELARLSGLPVQMDHIDRLLATRRDSFEREFFRLGMPAEDTSDQATLTMLARPLIKSLVSDMVVAQTSQASAGADGKKQTTTDAAAVACLQAIAAVQHLLCSTSNLFLTGGATSAQQHEALSLLTGCNKKPSQTSAGVVPAPVPPASQPPPPPLVPVPVTEPVSVPVPVSDKARATEAHGLAPLHSPGDTKASAPLESKRPVVIEVPAMVSSAGNGNGETNGAAAVQHKAPSAVPTARATAAAAATVGAGDSASASAGPGATGVAGVIGDMAAVCSMLNALGVKFQVDLCDGARITATF